MDDKFTQEEMEEIVNKFAEDADELAGIGRFFSFVRRDGDMPDQSNPHYFGLSRCWRWEWKTKGYPMVYTGPKRGIVAYRFAYRLFKGEIPKGACIMHRCDNKQCTNPDHLELGTNGENVRDAHRRGLVEKGRTRMKKGVQSIYAMCKVHNEIISFEKMVHYNAHQFVEADAFFKTETWALLKARIEQAFVAMISIHAPDMVDDRLKYQNYFFLKPADREVCDYLMTSDPAKVKILQPSKFDPSIHNKEINYHGF